MSKKLLTVIHHLRSADLLSLYTGISSTDEVMRFWIKRQDKLIHSYSLVGYLLSPNQTIMDHAYENRSLIHHEAVVNLIEKLIVDPKLVGVEKSTNLAELINNFWDEYHWFVNKQKIFKFDTCGNLQHEAIVSRRIDGIRDGLSTRQKF